MQDLEKKHTWIISMLSKWTWDPAASSQVLNWMGLSEIRFDQFTIIFGCFIASWLINTFWNLIDHWWWMVIANFCASQWYSPLITDWSVNFHCHWGHGEPVTVDGRRTRSRSPGLNGSMPPRAENDCLLPCRSPSHYLCSWWYYNNDKKIIIVIIVTITTIIMIIRI